MAICGGSGFKLHSCACHAAADACVHTRVRALVSNLTLIYMISQLYLYPNEYGVVVLVGFMFATIITFYIV